MSTPDIEQPPGSALTNAELVEIFAGVLNLTPERKKSLIGNICFCDSMDEDGNGGLWSPKNDYVSGGRLGRDHTLSDVPNHFVRDWLLEQIDEQANEAEELDEEQRQTLQRVLCPDLTADEVGEYSEVRAKKREDEQRAYRAKYGIPEENATPEEIRKCELKRIMLDYGFKHERQAETVLRMHEALKAVDTTVDLTPRVRPGAVRDYKKYPPLRKWSVLFPNTVGGVLQLEAELPPPVQIDRDCDQIRLMIRRFCLQEEDEPVTIWGADGQFELDQFVGALGISRQTMTAFLKKKGPENGDKSQAYELAWEFLKRRELCGFPLVQSERVVRVLDEEDSSLDGDEGGEEQATEEVDVLRARDSNRRSSKRPNEESDPGKQRSKRTRTTTIPSRRSERLKC